MAAVCKEVYSSYRSSPRHTWPWRPWQEASEHTWVASHCSSFPRVQSRGSTHVTQLPLGSAAELKFPPLGYLLVGIKPHRRSPEGGGALRPCPNHSRVFLASGTHLTHTAEPGCPHKADAQGHAPWSKQPIMGWQVCPPPPPPAQCPCLTLPEE